MLFPCTYGVLVHCKFLKSSLFYFFRDLLPECSSDGTPHTWEQKNLRDKDWCELKWGSYIEDIDITEPPILEYTNEIIMNWYEKRVKAVVERSGLVEVGIELVKIALDKNIGGLDALHCDLLTLESIVFSYEDELSYMTLEQLQNIEPAKRMILLTSKVRKFSDASRNN